MNELTKIAQIINGGMNQLGRKIDSLAMELRNRKHTDSKISVSIPEIKTDNLEKAIKDGLNTLEINIPEQQTPIIKFPEFPKFPKIPAPIVNVPETVVNVPPANITVTPTPVTFPDSMKVEGMDKLIEGVNRETEEYNIFDEVNSKKPLPIIVMGKNGKQITDFGGDFTAPSIVAIRVGSEAVGEDNLLPVTTDGFAIPMFDQQIIDEALAPATTIITYKRAGVTVATKTITVSGTTTTITVT
jgi:hypothetical protein